MGNTVDVKSPNDDLGHNICGNGYNGYCGNSGAADCAASSGPHNTGHCVEWFQGMFDAQFKWFKNTMEASTADWQIVTLHYPPTWPLPSYSSQQIHWKDFSAEYGIDLIITGHTHRQEVHYRDDHYLRMGDTAWVISGGGGGVTSEMRDYPQFDGNDDAYGYMDMEISSETIKIKAYSHGGKDLKDILRHNVTVFPRSRQKSWQAELEVVV